MIRFHGGAIPDREHAWRRGYIRAFAILALTLTVAYLAWRIVATIDLSVWWVAVPLLAFEVHNAVGLALFTFALWDIDVRPKFYNASRRRWSVAVLIPTYDEPVEVLLPTIAAAVTLEPAHETWVLDDGRRDEIRELAESLGARYLTRPNNEGAKAGNLNHALPYLGDTEFLAVVGRQNLMRPTDTHDASLLAPAC